MTGPGRVLWSRRATAQPSATGIPGCYRPLGADDGSMCYLAYTPDTQQDLLQDYPTCERCQAGCRAAQVYWTEKDFAK